MKQVYPNVVHLANSRADRLAELEQLCRTKIGEVLQVYLDAEANELVQRARYERIEDGAPVIYRNGHDPERPITTSAGTIAIRRPRLRGTPYESAVLPKHVRRLPSLDRTFHKLWLEGLSQRDFEPALRALLGADAPLSASTIARVNVQYRGEFDAWRTRRLDHEHFVYIWADGVHLGAGPTDERRVILVIIGADAQGRKHLVALDEAMSESALSWGEILRDLKERGLRAPRLAIADGANGFWAALSAAYPETAQQRCWLHKIRNVLDKVPEKLKPEIHRKLREVCESTTRAEAMSGINSLAVALSTDYPKAAACVRDDVDRMLAYLAFPEASWKSLRTTNPIESIFASVRLRTNVAKRLRSGASALYLVFKLIERLSATWRRIDGYQTIALAQEKVA
ncbi:MAG: IS256 family transposase [Candidatus Baltobacteraceae bacterium]